jgi:hypothetical protein
MDAPDMAKETIQIAAEDRVLQPPLTDHFERVGSVEDEQCGLFRLRSARDNVAVAIFRRAASHGLGLKAAAQSFATMRPLTLKAGRR